MTLNNRPINKWTLVVAFLWMLVGAGLSTMVELWWRTANPHEIHIHSAVVSPVPGEGNGYRLQVTADGPPAKDCLRFTQHALYRDYDVRDIQTIQNEKWARRTYVPLAAAVNGPRFGSVRDFSVTLYIPPSTESGKWNYVARSVYWCTVFPGFTKSSESTNSPVPIEIPKD